MLESDPYNNGVGLQPFSICSRPLITVAEQDAFNDSLRENGIRELFHQVLRLFVTALAMAAAGLSQHMAVGFSPPTCSASYCHY
jgi:hypothetical protein